MKNSIFVIKPYKWNGMWVFDDERVGLDKEPFVAGADTMIDGNRHAKGTHPPEWHHDEHLQIDVGKSPYRRSDDESPFVTDSLYVRRER